MTQDELDLSVGYVLKRVQSALRAAMDAALREHGLTTPQYACLELLDQRPGLSNADLARGAFVSRQSMNVVLRGLEENGLVERPARAAQGRALPVRLTAEGRERLRRAHADVFEIERRMVDVLDPERVALLRADLTRMAEELGG
ncbi:MarR family winged helix-turn-helix transcriptional regulator [Actinoallomurus rhizosphaericola]|uniref:MarR family winged helix-turn-helix transcriptional regulator n=1 Tax=Actinoallomurus rhizosphaericola TaxID=2952536 RepID=UPI002090F4A8|nr:MarR family transcriptional regulator [Actinoallomurus rhizosphaericola]MCO5994411.1 MarR family transcriptional regulator [Actinoallomurus rhizosphaericola]